MNNAVHYEDALMVKAAWYYYFENMTQQAIADRLSIIRMRVIKLLEAARRNLAGEQEEMHLMKEGLYTESKHRETFTTMFLRHGGSISE